MKKRKLWLLVGGIALVLVLALTPLMTGCAAPAEEEKPPVEEEKPPEKVWDLVFSTHEQEGSTTYKSMTYALDLVEQNSNGRIKFTKRYHSGQLFGPFEILNGVQTGAADVGFCLGVFYPAEMDLRNGLGLPLLADKAARGVLAESEMLKDPRLVKESNDMGIHYLSVTMGGYPLIYHSVPITKYEDLAGKSITAFGGFADAAVAWGGSPVFLQETELYESIQKGLLDIGFGFWSSIGLFKLYEVAQYTTNIGLGFYSFGDTQLVNLDTWNSLPPELQQVMEESFLQATPKLFEEQSKLDQQWVSAAKEAGMQLGSFSRADINKVKALSSAVVDSWVNLKPEDAGARKKLVQDWIDVYNSMTAPAGWDYDSNEFFPTPK